MYGSTWEAETRELGVQGHSWVLREFASLGSKETVPQSIKTKENSSNKDELDPSTLVRGLALETDCLGFTLSGGH